MAAILTSDTNKATTTESLTGTDTVKIVTPADLKYVLDLRIAQSYGITWDESTDAYTRTGTLVNVAVATKPADALLAVQAKMRRCLLSDAGVVNYYLSATNSALKDDGVTSSILTGADGQVMVEIPKFWYRHLYAGTTHTWEISPVPLAGFDVHPAFMSGATELNYVYVGAYEASLYDTSQTTYTGYYKTIPSHSVSVVKAYNTTKGRITSGTTSHLTSGSLVSGVTYKIITFVAGDNFSNVATVISGTINTTGCMFVATGVTPTTWSNGSSLHAAPYFSIYAGDVIQLTGTDVNGYYIVDTVTDSYDIVTTANLTGGADGTKATAVITAPLDWTATTGDKLSSVSGKMPVTNGTRANFRAAAVNRATGWTQELYDIRSAVQLLYLTEYASFYSQSMIGAGISNVNDWSAYNDYYPIVPTGKSNSYGNATCNVGTAAATCAVTLAANACMSYRGIENFYGHIWEWLDGLNVYETGGVHRAWVCNVAANLQDDVGAPNYTDLGVNIKADDGYQNALINISRGFLPAVGADADATTKITDYYWQSTGWRVGCSGGDAYYGASGGVCCLNLNNASSDVYQDVGGRPCFRK